MTTPQDKQPELRECPFCGKSPKLIDHRLAWTVQCEPCMVTVIGKRMPEPESPNDNEDWEDYMMDAVNKWNTRSYDAELTQAKSLLEKVCVLEVGSEPEVGDLVSMVVDLGVDKCTIYRECYHPFADPKEDLLVHAWGLRFEKVCKDAIIIQRKGLPVVYQDKGGVDVHPKEFAEVADNNQLKKEI